MATLESSATRFYHAPFINEPATNFTPEHTARKMRAALDKVRNELGREYATGRSASEGREGAR